MRIRFYLVIIVAAAALIVARHVWPVSSPVARAYGITMLPPTVEVSPSLASAVANVLATSAVDREIYTYAITDVSPKTGYTLVSVAGLPDDAQKMSLDAALWLGTVTIADSSDMSGVVNDPPPAQALAAAQTGRGGAGDILPFRTGTQAQYGELGVHACGYSLNGWMAVDLFPSENMVHASRAGFVTYVCRDDTQVSLRIGENLYAHLADTGQQVGDQYHQGQAMGALVPGTFSDTCGNAEQAPTAYHVHFCFVPDGNTFTADGYELNVNSSVWTKGEETVSPSGYLTANWTDAGVDVPVYAAAGSNFWDGFMGGISDIFENTVSVLPEHQDLGMAEQVAATSAPALELVSVIIAGTFDLTVILWVVGIIIALELVRVIYAGWMWIKRAIPIIG